jgi:hypothetical protein
MKIDLCELTDGCRYADDLQCVVDSLGGAAKVLRLKYSSDYSGDVDVDLLLNDGRVFSYYYAYGSCSGCDTWEAEFSCDSVKVQKAMRDECTIFNNITDYEKWRAMTLKQQKEDAEEYQRKYKEEQKKWNEYDGIVKKWDPTEIQEYIRKNMP